MASEIRVDKINSLSGVGTVTMSPTGVDIAGITTAATLRATTGIVTSLTAGSLTSLGAVSGTTGTFSGDVTVTGTNPIIHLTDTNDNSDYQLNVNGGVFQVYDYTNTAGRLLVASDGTVSVTGDMSIADKIIHTGDTNTAIRFPAADTVTVETDGTERYRITSDGKFVGGPLANGHSTARCAAGGLDLRAGQGGAGFPSIKIGADSGTANATTLTSNTRKQARIGCASYHNSYDFATFLYFDSNTSTNELNIGGGTGHGYAATSIGLWTAANNSTSTGTERMRVHSSGVVSFNNGIELGSGLDATTANTLDDYEEGTWTPDVVASSGSDSWAYRVAGWYTKVGRKVTASFSLGQYSGDLSGDIYINNLPFTVGSSFRQYIGDFGWYDINPPANTCGYFIYLPPNGTNAYPYWTISGGAGTQVTGAHLYASNRTFWEGNITYVVD